MKHPVHIPCCCIGLFDDDTITEMASCVPTREEIKNISQAIVKQNTRSDDY